MHHEIEFSSFSAHISQLSAGNACNILYSGKGIKKEDQGKLLRPNTHFTSYGTNNEKGSGLGLMLCKDFVEQLGGKLWFDSEEGKGTTFYFSLKVSNQE